MSMTVRRLDLTEAQWGEIYDILVADLDAPENLRFQFLQRYTSEQDTEREYRVCPALGFGGKLRFQGGKLDVYMYPEDETPERRALKKSVDAKLRQLLAKFHHKA